MQDGEPAQTTIADLPRDDVDRSSSNAERAKLRPANYLELDPREQWAIDKRLGILDWDGSYGKIRTPNLHERLIAKQSTEELRRKQRKAGQRGIWTQEDLDLARREAEELVAALTWD